MLHSCITQWGLCSLCFVGSRGFGKLIRLSYKRWYSFCPVLLGHLPLEPSHHALRQSSSWKSSKDFLFTATADIPVLSSLGLGGEWANDSSPRSSSNPREYQMEQRKTVPTKPSPIFKFMSKTNIVIVICYASIKNRNRTVSRNDVCHFQYEAFK